MTAPVHSFRRDLKSSAKLRKTSKRPAEVPVQAAFEAIAASNTRNASEPENIYQEQGTRSDAIPTRPIYDMIPALIRVYERQLVRVTILRRKSSE